LNGASQVAVAGGNDLCHPDALAFDRFTATGDLEQAARRGVFVKRHHRLSPFVKLLEASRELVGCADLNVDLRSGDALDRSDFKLELPVFNFFGLVIHIIDC
jgi:hypothetical protein